MFSFTGLQPTNGFRCAIPDSANQQCDGHNFSFSDFPVEMFPKEGSEEEPNYCKIYRPVLDTNWPGNCSHEAFTDEVMECGRDSEYAYEPFQFEETLVTKWDLVCDKRIMVSLVVSMYMLGLMIGSFICGPMADKYGRKITMMFSIFCSSSASLLGSLKYLEYYSYTATRVVAAVGAQGLFLSSFSLAVEIVG